MTRLERECRVMAIDLIHEPGDKDRWHVFADWLEEIFRDGNDEIRNRTIFLLHHAANCEKSFMTVRIEDVTVLDADAINSAFSLRRKATSYVVFSPVVPPGEKHMMSACELASTDDMSELPGPLAKQAITFKYSFDYTDDFDFLLGEWRRRRRKPKKD